MQRSSRFVAFATSNGHKSREAESILSEFGISLERLPGKGTEIQADDLSSIALFAAKEASRRYHKPVIVEDAGLFIDELNGFPGPYSSYIYRTLGLETFVQLLTSLRSRSAVFRSSVSYCAPNGEPLVFEGVSKGSIGSRPSGTYGFGFDPVFKPEGYESTFAEMTSEQKNRISHRGESLRKFALWFLQNE